MSIDPPLGPLTETIIIEALPAFQGHRAYAMNGSRRVLIAVADHGTGPRLTHDGDALRRILPGVRADDVLDLLHAGKCGEFSVDVHTVRPASRRDADFDEAA